MSMNYTRCTARNVNYSARVKQYYSVPDEEKPKYARKIFAALHVIIDKFNAGYKTSVKVETFWLDIEEGKACPSIVFNEEDKKQHGEMLLAKIYQEEPLFFKRLHNAKYQDVFYSDNGTQEMIFWEDIIIPYD